MKLISINVSLPKTVYHQRRRVSTGIYKELVTGRVMVRRLKVDGDGQGDLQANGGVYEGDCIYDMENIRYWREALGRKDLLHGHFGENFTVGGRPNGRVRIGDVFRIGGAELEVTQPRAPCLKLEMKMDLPGFFRRFPADGWLGFYRRVPEEGEVGPGDSIERIEVGPAKIAVLDFTRLHYFGTRKPCPPCLPICPPGFPLSGLAFPAFPDRWPALIPSQTATGIPSTTAYPSNGDHYPSSRAIGSSRQ